MTTANAYNIRARLHALRNQAENRINRIARQAQRKATPPTLTITASEIKALRQQTGLTQWEIAKKLLIAPRTWEAWEQGTKQPNQQAILILRMWQADKKAVYALIEKVREQG